jgi:hypothetical protein
MPGQVAEQLIVKVVADIQGALSGLQRMQQEFNKTASSASQMQNEFKKNYRSAGATFDTLGQHTEGVKYKMDMLKQEMLGLNISSVEGQRRMKVLGSTYKNLESSIAPVAKSTKNFSDALQNLGQNGFAQLDRMSGGVATALKEVGTSLGITSGLAVGAAAGLAGLAAGFKLVIQPGIEFNMMLEQQQVAFGVMLGSAEKAKVMMSELKKLSLTTPIGLPEGASGTKQLLAYGFQQSEIITNLKMMSTVAKAVNVPLQDVVYVYGTLRAQGRAYTRDLMQFAMRGIPIYEYLAKVMKVNVGAIKNLTEEGKIGFTQVEAAMRSMTGNGGKFFGLLEASMKTTQGRLVVLKNTWQMVTGEMASTSMGSLNSMITSLTKIVKTSEYWVLLFKAVYGYLMALAAYILKVVEILESIFSWFTVFVQVGARVVKNAWDWFTSLKPIAYLIKDIISPAVTFVAGVFKKIGDEIARWKAQLKEFASGLKQSFIKPEMFKIDMVMGGEDSLYKQVQEKLKDVVKESAGKDSVIELAYLSSEIQKIAEATGSTAEYVTQVFALSAGKTVAKYEELRDAITLTQNAFDIFQSRMDSYNIDDRIRATSGISGANTIYNVMDNTYEGIKKASERMVRFGMDGDTAFALVSEEAQTLKKQLLDLIKTMSGDDVFVAAENGVSTIEELIKKYLALPDVAKDGKAVDSLFDKYISFRVNPAFKETGEIMYWLGETTGKATYGLTQIERESFKIEHEYDDLRKTFKALPPDIAAFIDMMEKIEKIKAFTKTRSDELGASLALSLDANKFEGARDAAMSLYLVQQRAAMDLNQGAERQAALDKAYAELKKNILSIDTKRYELQESYIKSLSAIEPNYIIQIKYLNELYKLDLKRIDTNLTEDQRKAKALELEYKLRQDILETYKKQYDLMLKGNSDFFAGQKQQLVQNMTKGNGGAALGNAATMSMEGTDIGALMSGANPLVMFMTSLMETVMAVENVNKTLNFMKTIMEGVTAVIEGPLNTAFKPIVDVLTRLGKIIGVMLLPYIELLGYVLGTITDVLSPVLTYLELYHKAIAAVLKVVFALLYPFQALKQAITGFLDTVKTILMDSLSGTDVGTLLGGGNIFEMFLSSLADTVFAVENVNKVLNFMKTIMEGFSAVVSGPLNEAFKPIVHILTKLGEILGVILLPIIDTISWIFSTLADVLMPVLELIKVLLRILAPVITLFLKLTQPLIILLDAITQSLGLSYETIALQTDQNETLADLLDSQIKSLQDLYNVGAISGAEYEARLAALRGTPEEAAATADGPFATFLSGLYDNVVIITEWCNETYDLLIAPIIEALDPLWEALATIFPPEFTEAFTPLAEAVQDLFIVIGEGLADIVEILVEIFTSDAGQALLSALAEIGIGIIKDAILLVKDFIILIWNIISLFDPNLTPEERAATQQAIFDAMIAVLQNPVFRGIMNVLGTILRGIIIAIVGLIAIFNPLLAAIIAALTLPMFASGTMNVPKDMVARLHQGEMVVPKTFAQDMRSGMFSNGSGTGGSTNVFNINVEGKVVTERELIQSFSQEARKLKKQGYL